MPMGLQLITPPLKAPRACASAPPAMRGFCSVSRGLGQADPIGKLPGKIRDEKLGVLVTNQDNTMNSSEDSLQSLSSTNALGESLGRGLVSFTASLSVNLISYILVLVS